MKKLKTVADLTVDSRNANRGTERGMSMLDDSLDQCGFGRSVVVDREGNLIGGSKTTEKAFERGAEIIVVPSDGTKLVVVQRTDLELESEQGRKLATFDNRVGELNLEWDPGELDYAASMGVEIERMWTEAELDAMSEADGFNFQTEEGEGDPTQFGSDAPNATVTIGPYRFMVEREVFEAWQVRLREEAGYDDASCIRAIQQMLGFPVTTHAEEA